MKQGILLFTILLYLCISIPVSCMLIRQDPILMPLRTANDTIRAISSIDFKSFYGKPIDSLLQLGILEKYVHKRIVCEPGGCMQYLTMSFQSKKNYLSVDIYPPSILKHIPERCINYPKEQWDMMLFGREVVDSVRVILWR